MSETVISLEEVRRERLSEQLAAKRSAAARQNAAQTRQPPKRPLSALSTHPFKALRIRIDQWEIDAAGYDDDPCLKVYLQSLLDSRYLAFARIRSGTLLYDIVGSVIEYVNAHMLYEARLHGLPR